MTPATSAAVSSDAVTGDHPDWCLPAFCEPLGPVTMHLSAPVVWQLEDDDVDVIMRRRQEGTDGEAMIEVHFERQQGPEEQITMLVTEGDADRLRDGVSALLGLG